MPETASAEYAVTVSPDSRRTIQRNPCGELLCTKTGMHLMTTPRSGSWVLLGIKNGNANNVISMTPNAPTPYSPRFSIEAANT